jgi:hypothetical protein
MKGSTLEPSAKHERITETRFWLSPQSLIVGLLQPI